MKRASVFAAALLLALALAGTAMAQSATVMTDKSDYAPGTIVTITGTGWQPGETVTLTFLESPNIDTPPPLTAVADANGNIFNNQFSPDSYDVGILFTLTATGSSSGLQAQTTFTDNKTVTVAFAGTGSGSVTSTQPVGPPTITCTDTTGTASGTCSASFPNTQQVTLTATVAGGSTFGSWSVPAGYTINSGCTPSDLTCQFTMNNTSQTVTVTINGTVNQRRKGQTIVATLSPKDRYNVVVLR